MSGSRTNGSSLKRHAVGRWLLLNALLLSLVGLLSLTYPVEELSRRTGDMYFRMRANQGTSPHVALVLIDDASLGRYGRWPWKRSLLARVVSAVSAERPKALGLDILLSEAADDRDDRELARALRAAGNVVLVAKINNSPQGRLWVEPMPVFAGAAARVGHAQATLGPDSICRSVPARELTLEGPRWAFALEVARVASGASLEDDGRELKIGEQWIPTTTTSPSHAGIAGLSTETPRFLPIDYRGQVALGESSLPFSAVSVVDLLEGKTGGQLRGKAVFIGFGSTEIGDRIATPVSSRFPMSGVEIHANLADAILAGRSLRPLAGWLEFLFLFVFSLSATWVVLRWPFWRGFLANAGLLIGGLVAAYAAFTRMHLLVETGPFLCAGLLAGPLAQLQNLVLVDRGLTQGLRQLQLALKAVGPETRGNLSAAMRPEVPSAADDLHWKVHLLRQLQAELSSLYAFDHTLLEAMQEGLAVFSWDGRLVFRNQQWQSFCEKQGWNPVASLDSFVGALNEPRWHAIRESLAPPGLWIDAEAHLGGGLWQLRAVRLSSSSPAGAAELIMVVVSDQTARLERDRARAEALGFVTHELLTPLVSIQGFAEYLLRYTRDDVSSEAAGTIFQESGRLVAMINTYLDVLRLEVGARPLRRETVHISQTVGKVARVIRPLAQASEIKIRTQIAADLPTLEGDPHLIEGALLNLVSNAVKYGERKSEVTLCAELEGDAIVLGVWNAGPAIPPQELQHLFESFYRRPEQEDAVRGWGLGLAFVKRIAEQHGGRVEVRSEAGAGTFFRIHLPLTRVVFSEALQ